MTRPLSAQKSFSHLENRGDFSRAAPFTLSWSDIGARGHLSMSRRTVACGILDFRRILSAWRSGALEKWVHHRNISTETGLTGIPMVGRTLGKLVFQCSLPRHPLLARDRPSCASSMDGAFGPSEKTTPSRRPTRPTICACWRTLPMRFSLPLAAPSGCRQVKWEILKSAT